MTLLSNDTYSKESPSTKKLRGSMLKLPRQNFSSHTVALMITWLYQVIVVGIIPRHKDIKGTITSKLPVKGAFYLAEKGTFNTSFFFCQIKLQKKIFVHDFQMQNRSTSLLLPFHLPKLFTSRWPFFIHQTHDFSI